MPSKSTLKRKQTRLRAKSRVVGTPKAPQQPLANIIRHAGPSKETKNFFTGAANIQLYHNGSNGTTYGTYVPVIRPLDGMTAGIGDGYRTGNSVRAKSIRIRLWLSHKLDRPNVMWRVVIGANTGQNLPGTCAVYLNKAPTGEYMTAMPDPGVTLTLYDKIVNPNSYCNAIYPSAATLKERSYFHEILLPYNHDLEYNPGNSYPQSYTLCCLVVAYDAFGSLAADNIASYAYTTMLEYTDS